ARGRWRDPARHTRRCRDSGADRPRCGREASACVVPRDTKTSLGTGRRSYRYSHGRYFHAARRSQSTTGCTQIHTIERRPDLILATPSIPDRRCGPGSDIRASTRNELRPSSATVTGVILLRVIGTGSPGRPARATVPLCPTAI